MHPHLNLAAPSGPGTHMREVIEGFRQHGNEVVPFITGGTELSTASAPIQFRKSRFRAFIPDLVWHSIKDLYFIRQDRLIKERLKAEIERVRPDMVYERGCYLSKAASAVCKELQLPHFIEINAPYPEEKRMLEGKSLTHFLGDTAERYQVNSATKVFVVSSAMKEYLIRRTGCAENKIVVTPNAVNPVTFSAKRLISKKDLGIADNARVVGFVGSIFPYHGVDILIEAFAEIAQSRTETLHLLVVGDGETLPLLKQYASKIGIEKQIIFTGNIAHENIPDYIAMMDIAVMAKSNWYGSPVKIFEYGWMQKLIIAPNTSPVRDVMVHDTDGLLIEAGKDELKAALFSALESPSKAQSMATHFHEKVKNQFTWRHITQTILDQYQR